MLVSGGGGEVVVFHVNFLPSFEDWKFFLDHLLKPVISKASERESARLWTYVQETPPAKRIVNLCTKNASRQKT